MNRENNFYVDEIIDIDMFFEYFNFFAKNVAYVISIENTNEKMICDRHNYVKKIYKTIVKYLTNNHQQIEYNKNIIKSKMTTHSTFLNDVKILR